MCQFVCANFASIFKKCWCRHRRKNPLNLDSRLDAKGKTYWRKPIRGGFIVCSLKTLLFQEEPMSQWKVRWGVFFSANCLRTAQCMSSTIRILSFGSPLARRQRQWQLRRGAVMSSFYQAVGCLKLRREIKSICIAFFRSKPTTCSSSLRQWKRSYPACKNWRR